jgi:hypothetical protein
MKIVKNPVAKQGLQYLNTASDFETDYLNLDQTTPQTIINGPLNVGTETAGQNINANATLGDELIPPLTGATGVNWTFGACYETPLNGTINKNADGVNYITPKTGTITRYATHRLIIVCDEVSVGTGMSVAFAGINLGYITTAGTYTYYVSALSTAKLVLTPSASATRFVISSISCKMITDGTGEVSAYGDIRMAGILSNLNGTVGLSITPAGLVVAPLIQTTSLTALGSGTFSDNIAITKSNIKTTPTDAVIITNSSSTTTSNKIQMSPRIRLQGSAWDTDDAVSRTTNWAIDNLPITGDIVSSQLRFGHSLAGAEYTNLMLLSSDGNLSLGTSTPDANAILDLTSTTKAFMPPRMTTTQRDAISSPVEGMVIYNLTTHNLDFYNGTTWGAV